MEGLLNLGIFDVVQESERESSRIYDYVFVDSRKKDSRLRSRFFVKKYNNISHGLSNFSPTLRRIPLRILLFFHYPWPMYAPDITEAFFKQRESVEDLFS